MCVGLCVKFVGDRVRRKAAKSLLMAGPKDDRLFVQHNKLMCAFVSIQ